MQEIDIDCLLHMIFVNFFSKHISELQSKNLTMPKSPSVGEIELILIAYSSYS